MSVTAIKNPSTVALQLVTNKIKEQLSENKLKAVANGEQFILAEPISTLGISTKIPGTFTITFSYQQNLHRTKVQLTNTGYGKQIYKVALNSALTSECNVCWLQQINGSWETLLGNNISEGLKSAITSAIEDQA